jgi:1-acyl-sn-glycerol-3-phosphate acyltransferase
VVFLAKAEYFDKWYLRGFLRMARVIPVGGEERAGDALRAAARALEEGNLVGIFPEGTRSRDGRLYRGKTGVARIAWKTGAPVIPVAMFGTFEAMPQGRLLPRPRRIRIRFGPPLVFDAAQMDGDPRALRSATDRIMSEIRRLSGQEYVDEYAPQARARD